MAATCGKPSSGACVAWVETTLERLGLTLSLEEWRRPRGDPTKQLLYPGAETDIISERLSWPFVDPSGQLK